MSPSLPLIAECFCTGVTRVLCLCGYQMLNEGNLLCERTSLSLATNCGPAKTSWTVKGPNGQIRRIQTHVCAKLVSCALTKKNSSFLLPLTATVTRPASQDPMPPCPWQPQPPTMLCLTLLIAAVCSSDLIDVRRLLQQQGAQGQLTDSYSTAGTSGRPPASLPLHNATASNTCKGWNHPQPHLTNAQRLQEAAALLLGLGRRLLARLLLRGRARLGLLRAQHRSAAY